MVFWLARQNVFGTDWTDITVLITGPFDM